MKLLVPVDCSQEESWRVVDQATELAGRIERSSITLLMVRADPGDRLAHDKMSELAEGVLKAGSTCTYLVVDGEPAPRILEHAAEHDLVVMGTHGRTGLKRAFLGSVAEAVIRASTVPVMVVKVTG